MTTDLNDATTTRIAELVEHLTGSGRADAADTVSELHPGGMLSADEALAVVARAVHELGGPAGAADASPRVAGYVRAGRDRVIDLRDRGPRTPPAVDELRVARYVPEARPHLVEHRSLRRWERSAAPVT